MSGTTFSFQYFISIILALGGAFAADQNLPNMNPIIKLFVIPLFIAYITLLFMNTFLPKFTKWADEVGSYVEDKAYGEINSLGYMQIFPPIFAVFLIFIILIYNRSI